MAAGKQLKGKKKWFTVVAPQLFNSKEIADIPAYSAEELQHRFVEATGQMLTGLPKDANRKYQLQIIETKADKAATAPAGYYLTEGFVQRFARRYKDRFVYVLTVGTKDGKQVRFKWFFLNVKKLHHSVRGEILRQTKNLTTDAAKEFDSVKIFEPAAIDKIDRKSVV